VTRTHVAEAIAVLATVACPLDVEGVFLTAVMPGTAREFERRCLAHFEHCCRAWMDEWADFERIISEAKEGRLGKRRHKKNLTLSCILVAPSS
jgi:hypothetical protein